MNSFYSLDINPYWIYYLQISYDRFILCTKRKKYLTWCKILKVFLSLAQRSHSGTLDELDYIIPLGA